MTQSTHTLIAATVEVNLESKLKTANSTVKFFDLATIISNLSNIIIYIGGIAAFAWFLMGSLNWILSGGDKAKIDAAKNQITQAVIGLGVLVSAYALFSVIQYVLGLQIVK